MHHSIADISAFVKASLFQQLFLFLKRLNLIYFEIKSVFSHGKMFFFQHAGKYYTKTTVSSNLIMQEYLRFKAKSNT